MANLSIVNNLEVTSQGTVTTAKQGTATDAFATPYVLTVSGAEVTRKGVIAAELTEPIYDVSSDRPMDWQYCHITVDGPGFVQLIGETSNVVLPLVANVPFTLSGRSLIAAADTAPMDSLTEVEDLAIVLLANYGSGPLSYRAVFIN